MNTYNRYNWNQVLWGLALMMAGLIGVAWIICGGLQ